MIVELHLAASVSGSWHYSYWFIYWEWNRIIIEVISNTFFELSFFMHVCLLYLRAQRWSFLCGCPKVCTRRRGGCCLSIFLKFTKKAGGPCSTLTPMWWTCIRWAPTTTAWDPRCCTLTVQRTRRSHRRCCR